ncbi:zinc dependent phospholipase C family protein [Bacillus horti]|uniref:Phospholipase C/D domain-containing protein n=2 Tax=Caldalkalibacillus horti TaxID=77523 RepID=A0ABT9W3A7_9BACI|nr:zinc dependent phospholipase C family protein [Bacillus horti]MDQ0167325.1 hypothetical protein [Bacillus horti]
MPWPMVHFLVSENLYNGNPSPNLLLGSIAPDAIHMRGEISRQEKGITHLVHNDQFPAVEVILDTLHTYLEQKSEQEWRGFIIGYFSHVYTDVMWTNTVYEDFENNFNGDKMDLRRIYRQEVSQLEFDLMKSSRNRKVTGFTSKG